MAVATQLKSMDFLMFARASEGLTHVRGIVVSFLAMLFGGAFLLDPRRAGEEVMSVKAIQHA